MFVHPCPKILPSPHTRLAGDNRAESGKSEGTQQVSAISGLLY